jgi:D-3-phosphoglycerate dehydrogenase
MPKIAITDYTFPDLSLEEAVLRPAGIEIVSFKEKRSPAELAELVRDADAVIAQFAPVNAEVVAAMTKAKAIVRYGIGYDNVDFTAARERGIPVCNIPDYFSAPRDDTARASCGNGAKSDFLSLLRCDDVRS